MKVKKIPVEVFFGERIAALEASGQFSTSMNYRRTCRSFLSFLAGKPLYMCDLTAEEVALYNRWLRGQGLKRNTLSFYNRILRAVFNQAVNQGYAQPADLFRHVYTGVDATRKRALPQQALRRIAALTLPDPDLALARDLFLFSFQARGMSFVDMAFLTRDNLRGGALRYIRRKTGQSLEVRLEPWMEATLARYRPLCRGPYLLPILSATEPKEAYLQYTRAISRHNRRLGVIGRMAGLPHPLSTYSARHSWATVARDMQVPLSVISSGMGHTSEKTTRIYLDSLDLALVDQANRRIWNAVSGPSGGGD